VTRVLLTGMSGTGKSMVIEELASRGYRAVDTDENGLSELVAVPADHPTGLDSGQDWMWREDRIRALLSTDQGDVLFLGGCAPNQGKFYPWFDHVILLTAPPGVIVERLATRTTNPYGKRPEEVARVLHLQQTIEPVLRRGAGHVVDTSAPLDEVVATVLRIAGIPRAIAFRFARVSRFLRACSRPPGPLAPSARLRILRRWQHHPGRIRSREGTLAQLTGIGTINAQLC
jgi:shikimate kinase